MLLLQRLVSQIKKENCVPVSLAEAAQSLGIKMPFQRFVDAYPSQTTHLAIDIIPTMIQAAKQVGMQVPHVIIFEVALEHIQCPVEIPCTVEDERRGIPISPPALLILGKPSPSLIFHVDTLTEGILSAARFEAYGQHDWFLLAALELSTI